MAHMPRRERIAQIVATLVDAPTALTAYAVAKRVKMSVSAHLYSLLDDACDKGLAMREVTEYPNGKPVSLFISTHQRVEECADTEMLNLVYSKSKTHYWFSGSEIPF